MRFNIDTSKLATIAKRVKTIHDKISKELKIDDDDINVIPVELGTMENIRDIISLDGSYSVLWKSPIYPLWIVITRTALLRRSYDPVEIKIKRVYDDYVDNIEIIDGHEMTIDRDGETEIIPNDEGFNPNNIEAYISHKSVRQEEDETLKIANANENVMILYDGALNSPNTDNKRAQFLKNTIDACEENNNVLVGITKDSNFKRINNMTKDEIVLNKYSERNPGFTGYYMLDEGHETGFGTCFARLHPSAYKWFRVDFLARTTMSVPEIIETIACYSRVNTLPGTPYPPLCAHEIAVKVRQLKKIMEEKFMKLLVKEGIPMDMIVRGLTTVGGAPVTGKYHDHLDLFTKMRKKISI